MFEHKQFDFHYNISITITMEAFVMLFLMIVSNGIYSLPAINFTDTAIPNQMIKTLSEALAPAPQVNPRGRKK
jgi:hypothetical protein